MLFHRYFTGPLYDPKPLVTGVFATRKALMRDFDDFFIASPNMLIN